MSIFDIGLLNTSYTAMDALSFGDPIDRYNFAVGDSSTVNFSLAGTVAGVDWKLTDSDGVVLYDGTTSGMGVDTLAFNDLPAGNYSLSVASYAGSDAAYGIGLDPLTGNIDSGVFAVGSTGLVGFDPLLDGGGYQGELGSFSLSGMEAFVPGSIAYQQEAARRALSGTTEGHVVFSDATEGAKFSASFPWEGDFNRGEYRGLKVFEMTPGDRFGVILVPQGTLQEVFENPFLEENKRPLFSMATSNPNDAFHFGQIADVTGDGKTFTIEDLQIDRSDRDYNDLVFRVTGATGIAPGLDGIIDRDKDWRNDPVGVELRDYVNTPPKFSELIVQPVYLVGQPIALSDVKVLDENGDLSEVSFSLQKEGETWQSLTPHNGFTRNEDGAIFDYTLPSLGAGNYQLKAIAVDGAGKTSEEVVRSFEVRSVNTTPDRLYFTLPEGSFHSGETVELLGGTVYDAEGANDIVKVDFALRQENGEWVDISDAIEFTSDGTDSNKLIFNYTLKLENLGAGNYEVRGIAVDRLGLTSNTVIRSFSIAGNAEVNVAPTGLQFETSTMGDRVRITGGKVYDENGAIDLAKVDFEIQKEGGEWQDVSDVTGFVADTTDNRWATFEDSIHGLEPGNYKLRATAYDLAGNPSNVAVSNFAIELPNQAPEDLKFSIFPLYTNAETISFSGARVTDADGVSNLEEVEFLLLGPNNIWYDIPDVTEFTTDSQGRGRFSYSYDLTGLLPGTYTLYGIARDKTGALSNPVEQPFTMISDSGEELSDEERIAIANAVNLNQYTPEEIEQSREWVVWVTPGQSSADLAEQIQAQDRGATDFIPNTYTWEFPEDLSSNEVMTRLNSVAGVELYYPLVPRDVELLSDPLVKQPENWTFTYPVMDTNNETLINLLNSYQWHLRSRVNSDADANITEAWKLAKGNGVVIGIVDDGLETSHPDLKERFIPEFSTDFNENDDDPSPSYRRIILELNKIENIQTGDINDGKTNYFLLDVSLTGVVKDVDVFLDIKHFNVSDLVAILNSPDEPLFNPTIGLSSGRPRRINGGDGDADVVLFKNVGGDGKHFTATRLDDEAAISIAKGFAPFTGSFKPTNRLSTFDRYWVTGNWKLSIEDRVSIEAGKLNLWGLEFQTYNPHGTPVAGIAAASENNVGGTGVAPLASLAGLRLLADEITDAQIADALSHKSQDIDIYNNSWKEEEWLNKSPGSLKMSTGVREGRNGLGSIYVFGAGNDRQGGGNVNYNGFANSRYVIPVAAIDHTGEQNTYSESGASLLVSAYSSNSDVKISTTDLTGSDGYSNGTDGYLDPNYTNSFGGTSAAAPIVSGVAALMLEVNPKVSWRDIQHILVRTTNKNDPEDSDWTTNGAGYHINHKYGFGAIDAAAAVEMAQTWTPVAEEVKVSSVLQNVDDLIPDGNNEGLTSSIEIADDITIEKVEVNFTADHPDWRDLHIVLTSPDGTESVLAESRSSDPNPENQYQLKHELDKNGHYTFQWTFTSARHWDESSQGEWTLKVYDDNTNEIGEFIDWKLNIYGTEQAVTLDVTDAAAAETGDRGSFTITRNGNTKHSLTVPYNLGGTATNGTDYANLTGSVVIPAGEESVTVAIDPIDDLLMEGDETVEVTLVDGEGYRLGGQTSGRVEINDDVTPEPFTPLNTSLELSQPVWGDYDKDGDLDILSASAIGRNDNGNFTAIDLGITNARSAAWGDYDNDGDLDALITDGEVWASNTNIYRNDSGLFNPVRSLPGVSAASIEWGDYDNDGDLDLLLTGLDNSNQPSSKIYRNDGSDIFTDINASLQAVEGGSSTWGDYDNDGDLDILLTGPIGNIGPTISKVYRNDAGNFTDIGASLTAMYLNSALWGDYDNDGDLDILLAGDTGIDGNSNTPDYTRISKVYQNNSGTFTEIETSLHDLGTGFLFGHAGWGDYDNDGDLDILLTGRDNSNQLLSKIYLNEGNGSFSDSGISPDGSLFAPWGDYDNDGDLDILSTTGDTIYQNNAVTLNTIPTAPTNLNTLIEGSSVTFNWNPAADAQTPQNGLTYNLRVGTTPGGSEIMSPMANSDGTRQVVQMGNVNHNTDWTLNNLEPGTYYWSVQSIDSAFSGSEFASEGSFTVVANSILADSVQEFSFNQGQDNWYYGYYDGNLTSADFKQFTAIDSNDPNLGWIVDGTDYYNSTYWTIIGPTETHPSGLALSTRTSDEQWATRRWISEVEGIINLSGTLKKMDTTGGNGVIGRIYVDGVEVWSQEIAANDGVGVNYNFLTEVNPGSTVDFVLDPKDSEQFNDRSIFTGVVTLPKFVGAVGGISSTVTRD